MMFLTWKNPGDYAVIVTAKENGADEVNLTVSLGTNTQTVSLKKKGPFKSIGLVDFVTVQLNFQWDCVLDQSSYLFNVNGIIVRGGIVEVGVDAQLKLSME